MTAAEVHVVTETEIERVEHWRAEELIRAGLRPGRRGGAGGQARHRPALRGRADRAGLPLRDGDRNPDLDRPPDAGVETSGQNVARVSLAFIPSPHSGTIDLGPLTIHMYGLMLLLAIAACIWLTGVRWVRRGGDWDLVLKVAVWGVAAGIVGARALPRHHELERGLEPEVEGRLRGLGGRPRRLGRDPARLPRRRVHRPPRGRLRVQVHGRGRAGPPARAGDRPHRQLVEPGALRQADRPAVGPEDRLRAPRRRLREHRDLPPDLPLRVHLRPRRRRDPAAARPALPLQAAGAVRALRLVLHGRALLRGAAADRPGAPLRRAAPERLGLDRRLRDLDRVLHLVAVHPRRRGRPAADRPAAEQREPEGPAMAIPRGRVR